MILEITDKELDLIEAGLRAQQSYLYNKHMDRWAEGGKSYEDSPEFTEVSKKIGRLESLVQDLRLAQLAQSEPTTIPKFKTINNRL